MLRLFLLFLLVATCGLNLSVADSSTAACVCDSENEMNVTNQALRMRMEILTARQDEHFQLLRDLREEMNILKSKSAVKAITNETTCKSVVRLPQSCAEATANSRKSGLYTIQDDLVGNTPFLVSCDEDQHGGAWTVIQRRIDGSVEFYRNWTEYKLGFGNLDGEFWIGLDKLHALTTRTPQELLIVMEDFDNVTRFAHYEAFAIGDESEAYTLKVLGKYSGDAGDSLTADASHKFSTMDVDNDDSSMHFAQIHRGAWWYQKYYYSNLNGNYFRGAHNPDPFTKGVVWHKLRGSYYSLKFVQMMVRPRRV